MKWRLFRAITDPEAINAYQWHIARRRNSGFVDSNKGHLDVFIPQARKLLASMAQDGFDYNWPIPVDANGDILGGAHRTACALALGIDVRCERMEERAWAPEWDAAWFRQHGAPEDYVEGLIKDMEALRG